MNKILVYNFKKESNYNLIIEPGHYYYEFDENDEINIKFIQVGDIELNQEDVFFEFDDDTIILTLNKIGVSCEIILQKNNEIINKVKLL